MNSNDPSSQRGTYFKLFIGFFIGYLLASFVEDAFTGLVGANSGHSETMVREHLNKVENVVLKYQYETSESSAVGNDSLEVASIEFHPNYVVVNAANGSASLFAVDRLKRFNYRPAESK